MSIRSLYFQSDFLIWPTEDPLTPDFWPNVTYSYTQKVEISKDQINYWLLTENMKNWVNKIRPNGKKSPHKIRLYNSLFCKAEYQTVQLTKKPNNMPKNLQYELTRLGKRDGPLNIHKKTRRPNRLRAPVQLAQHYAAEKLNNVHPSNGLSVHLAILFSPKINNVWSKTENKDWKSYFINKRIRYFGLFIFEQIFGRLLLIRRPNYSQSVKIYSRKYEAV